MSHRAFNENALRPVVAVVGLGKIGLPLAVHYAQHGYKVIGCDVNRTVVETINAGQSHIQEEPGLVSGVAEMIGQGLLTATLDTTEAVRGANVVVVIVPVLVDAQHQVDFGPIDAATQTMGAGLQRGTLVIYETTLPVGTTAQRFGQQLAYVSHLKAGQDFYLAYSPERVWSGRIFRDLRTYPKVVGGINEDSTAAATAFYRSVLDTEIITLASADEAEFVKLIDTTYRDVNIALANEFARYADTFGLNIQTSIAAANSQPQSHIHSPGVGVGGHCIPVYPYFLFSRLEELDHQAHDTAAPMLLLARYARRINDAMAEYAAQRIEFILGSLAKRAVLILGVTYRGNVRETAFSSAKLLREALLRRGAKVYADDPLFSREELQASGYTPLAAEQCGDIEAIILQADHTSYRSFDFRRFPHCQVVLDGRHTLQRETAEECGIRYIAIGDGGSFAKINPEQD